MEKIDTDYRQRIGKMEAKLFKQFNRDVASLSLPSTLPVTNTKLFENALSPGGGGNWVGVWGPLPKSLTLFITKICDLPYPIYDLTKNSKPYLRPDS